MPSTLWVGLGNISLKYNELNQYMYISNIITDKKSSNQKYWNLCSGHCLFWPNFGITGLNKCDQTIVWTASSEFGTYSLYEPIRAAKVQASLRIRAVSPEPSLLAHTSSESKGTFRQKARSLTPLNGWACAVKICHDGMLEDTNSLDMARMIWYVPLDTQTWSN